MTPRVQRAVALSAGALAGAALLAFALVSGRDAKVTATAPASPALPSAPLTPAPAVFERKPNLREQFVGSDACASCHRTQAEAYAKSHHAAALVVPTADKLKTKLAGASFSTVLGGTTRFSERKGQLEVTSPGAEGHPRSLPLAYAAGVWPLQQYVVATERGKLQSLGVAWDSRGANVGGERWFHVYGPRGIGHDDALFFTRPAQNWNHVCADCHSTFVERRYDASEDRFDTRWVELSVGCEACHGPGAEHVRLAKAGAQGAAWGKASGFPVALKPALPWSPSPTGSPSRRAPDTVELEVCAPCHSRREPIHEGFLAGDPLLDAFEPELLRPSRYHADGQVEGEVYEWGSFLQSKMHASGVRCSDCHEPHSATLAEDNALCARCHAPARFDVAAHSHHTGESAPRCVDCHMPPAVFMQIDQRRDHSLRIPRPDHSVEFGTPNACNGCHAKQPPSWALARVEQWYPSSPRRPHFVEALGRDRQGTLDAPRRLAELAGDSTAPAIARATALERLGHYPLRTATATLRASLSSSEPLVVYGAVLGAGALPLPQRAPLLLSVIDHRVRAVRIAAGKALAGLPLGELPPDARAAVERSFAAVEESFAVSASRPESHVERSSFELARGNLGEAEAALGTALRLAPCLAEAHLNLADLARRQSDEATAEREIRAALACDPQNAFAHHALGLALIRKRDARAAIRSLEKAVELRPTETRFRYVLAVAVADRGDTEDAVKIVKIALAQRPNDPDLLNALAAYEARLGHVEAAADAQQKLDGLRE